MSAPLCYPCTRCGAARLVLADVVTVRTRGTYAVQMLCPDCTQGSPVVRFVRGEK